MDTLTHIETCTAKAEAAGWSGRALQRLILDPKAGTPEGFRALLHEANEIRSLVRIVAPNMRGLGYRADDTVAADFVARGATPQQVREDTARVMAEADEATHTCTIRSATGGVADPYAARSAEVAAYWARRS